MLFRSLGVSLGINLMPSDGKVCSFDCVYCECGFNGMRDDNFTVEELGAIAFGYTKLLEESNDVLTELKNVVNITTLSMTDKERMDVVERCYSKMKRYRNLVSYYTNKNISVSYLRAKKKNDLDRIMGLYGNMNERYW